MKTSGTHAFVNQVMVGLLVTIGFGGSIGLGTVWARHRISVLAENNAALVRQLAELDRHYTDTSALVEEALSLDVLRSQNEKMHLGMVDLTNIPIHPVPIDPTSLLVAKANRRVFERDAAGGKGVGLQLNFAPNGSAGSGLPGVAAAKAGDSALQQGKGTARANPALKFQLATNP